MDDIDRAQEHIEKEALGYVARSRKPAGPVPTGRCHYCDGPVAPALRWCGDECRADWDKERAAHRRNRGAA